MPNEPEPPASSGRARNATAGAERRADRSNRRWPLRPKFDVDLEIRDSLIAPLPFVDRCRSTTGTTIGVGSPSPFLSWSAPRRCTASMLAGYRRAPSASKILAMPIGLVSSHSPSGYVSAIGLPDISWRGRLHQRSARTMPSVYRASAGETARTSSTIGAVCKCPPSRGDTATPLHAAAERQSTSAVAEIVFMPWSLFSFRTAPPSLAPSS
jgi:hypothetical protein